jgi:cellulose synthase/poly-beta-1,6-N-acetylglucosamine synthase-like glycosyltransferase
MTPAGARTPSVTVLMPVLNADPRFLGEAVRSILGQTHRDLELLVVEDPSPRPARELLESFRDPRLRHLVNPTRTSFVEQLNRGLAEARSPLVARMDADDVAETDRIERQTEFLSRSGADVVGSQLRIIDETGRCVAHRRYPTGHKQIVASLKRFNALAHPSVLFRKEVVLRGGGYQCPELAPAEDYELWCRLATLGARFGNVPEALLRYRIHPESSKSVHTVRTLRSTLAVKRMYWLGRMGVVDRLRMLAERLLLLLPPSVIRRLFVRWQYRRPLSTR